MGGEGKGFRVKLERFFRSRDRGTRLSALKQRGLHRESLEEDSKRAVTEVFSFLFLSIFSNPYVVCYHIWQTKEGRAFWLNLARINSEQSQNWASMLQRVNCLV